MSHKIIFASVFLALCCACSFAQDSVTVTTNTKYGTQIKTKIPMDSAMKKHIRESELRYEREHADIIGLKQGIDSLIGMHIDSAMKIISKYQYAHVSRDHYPFIKDVIAISGLKMWDVPATEYLFVDESNKISRIHYRFWKNEVHTDKFTTVGGYSEHQIKPTRHPLNANWDMTIWNDAGTEHFFMYQKGEKGVRPSYSLTTEEFKTKLLDYAKNNTVTSDGIFTESVELFSDN